MATEFETAGLDGERRQVTVLFADLVGFTAFSERSGEEAAFSLMSARSRNDGECRRRAGRLG